MATASEESLERVMRHLRPRQTLAAWLKTAALAPGPHSERRATYVHPDQAKHCVRPRHLGRRFVLNKVIRPLLAEGYEVIAAQYGLDSLESDVAAVARTLGRVSSPAILVGHSYGGSVITAAGTDDRVAGLVYIAALAPDETETSQSQGTSSR